MCVCVWVLCGARDRIDAYSYRSQPLLPSFPSTHTTQVKKAYQQLVDEERRAWCILTINETRKRTLKERRQKLAKGTAVLWFVWCRIECRQEAVRRC